MDLKRRDFLKTGLFTSMAALLQEPTLKAFAKTSTMTPQEEISARLDQGKWISSTCQGCTTWCPVEIMVHQGRAVKIKGNSFSKQNFGYVCPRGHLSIQLQYDPDRVKVPLKRTNPQKGRGIDPKFVPISWDEALNIIAEKMLELRKNGEPHKFALLRGRYTYMNPIIYDALPKIFGSPNNISHSSICAEAEKFGPYYTEGMWEYRDYDLDHCKYLVLWGCDPTNSNRMVPGFIKKFGEVLERATVVAVDPRMQTTASKAHIWLPIIPGTDGALAVALAHVILVEGLWNKEFVGDFKDGKNRFKPGVEVDETTFEEKYTFGLVKWWNLELKDKTPAWAEKICGIAKEKIIEVARGMGKAAPHVIVWLGPGASMQVRGAYASLAIHALNGLLGSIDQKGGIMYTMKQPTKSAPSIDKYMDEIAKKHSKMKKIDQRGYKHLPSLAQGKPGGGVVTNNVATAILNSDPYDIKMILAYRCNFVFSCTGAQRWEKALEKVPFIAHITTHLSEFSWYADIVLPAAFNMYETWGFVKNKACGYSYVSLQKPVVKPLWDVKMDETEIPFLIAKKLKDKGFPNLYEYYVNEFKDPETGLPPRNEKEFAIFALKYFTSPLWQGEGAKYGEKLNSWEEFLERGIWNSKPYEFKKRWGNFGTVTKKFEFYSETLKKALKAHAENHKTTIDDVLAVCKYTARGELAFIPHYEPPYYHGDPKEYPLVFVDYKSRLNREGRSQNAPWYYEFHKVDFGDEAHEDYLLINPEDAKKIGIKTGDTVRLTSVSGSFKIKVKLWEGIRPGTVAKCYGQGHWAYGKVAAKVFGYEPRGVNNNEIMPFDTEALSGSNVRNGGFCRVRIEKV